MQTVTTHQITRRQFLKTSATAGLILGLAPYLPGCANDPWSNEDQGIKNPFNGFTIGDGYFINQDKLDHDYRAFDTENLAKLTYPMSKTQDVEIITTTNRASRTEDDFSVGVAATVKAKFLGGSFGLSNTYNHSTSKVNAENTLTWSSRDTRTGQVFSISWEKYKYTDFYGCLNKNAQKKLADIFDYYDQTIQLIAAGKMNTDEGQAVAKKYQQAVQQWYSSYGYGFVSGLWVGMLGKAELTINSTASNTTTRYDESATVSYAKPAGGGRLDVAFSGLSAEYSSKAYGKAIAAVMPDTPDMQKWKASWLDKFTPHLASISEMLKIDPTPSAYTGTPVTPPQLDLPTAKVDPKVSDKFKVTDLETAKACARVIDWEKNGNPGETFEDYLARKEQERQAVQLQFEGKGKPGQFEQEVQEIIGDKALRLLGTDVSLAVEADPNPSTTPWADFMQQWTTLGVYITRWADVIPPLTMAADVKSTDADLTSGLAYLWALRYQTELTRFADYIDLCYPYAMNFAWKDQATNIFSFGNQLRNYAKAFDAAIKNKLGYATEHPEYTSQQFYNDLEKVRSDQLAQMSMPKMYACWSQNYDFFKQADFGCGLVMMPEGYGADAPQLFLAGPRDWTCWYYGDEAYEVRWLLTQFDSKDYVRQPALFANLPKLLPLICADGRITFYMIGSLFVENWNGSGILDAFIEMRKADHYDHGEAFTVGSLSMVENESRVFLAKDVSQRVYDAFAWHYDKLSKRWWGSRIYKDPSSDDAFYLTGKSAIGRADEYTYLSNASCGEKTIFYLVPLSGFAEGTKVRGVKISEELPDYVANPFNLYSSSTAELLLEDTPSAVYESTLPTSTEDLMDIVLNKYRVWKGIVPAPE